ncbi:LuxR C-terminal-related transcriptional regulator [Sphingobium sp. BYY-5]|uniref:response regulator transcription factor n=1 Tax=Sphingobium sp. BYY-5 TaxID=2926400 RepID=UPI001FA7B262|nr:LuxR C-terminal-related transcriptional regulator [Sphingobium sp. BYY-5]MCI4592458.1 LuxR C-terminal-related transcriptional regulator [Sphingobium sp. BYY-5]
MSDASGENAYRDRRRGISVASLSARERDVLGGIVRGLTNKEIGIELGISHRTVEIHRARLMRKLDVKTLAALLAIALAERDTLPKPARNVPA